MKLAAALRRVPARLRVIISGTPIQVGGCAYGLMPKRGAGCCVKAWSTCTQEVPVWLQGAAAAVTDNKQLSAAFSAHQNHIMRQLAELMQAWAWRRLSFAALCGHEQPPRLLLPTFSLHQLSARNCNCKLTPAFLVCRTTCWRCMRCLTTSTRACWVAAAHLHSKAPLHLACVCRLWACVHPSTYMQHMLVLHYVPASTCCSVRYVQQHSTRRECTTLVCTNRCLYAVHRANT